MAIQPIVTATRKAEGLDMHLEFLQTKNKECKEYQIINDTVNGIKKYYI